MTSLLTLTRLFLSTSPIPSIIVSLRANASLPQIGQMLIAYFPQQLHAWFEPHFVPSFFNSALERPSFQETFPRPLFQHRPQSCQANTFQTHTHIVQRPLEGHSKRVQATPLQNHCHQRPFSHSADQSRAKPILPSKNHCATCCMAHQYRAGALPAHLSSPCRSVGLPAGHRMTLLSLPIQWNAFCRRANHRFMHPCSRK